ncbi:MAG TPA: tetratricopeptide repeat protein [Nocardioidaceae bacterium]|nr:tetratricopeptide repeat protein [Nocardioidaceae bacterium]
MTAPNTLGPARRVDTTEPSSVASVADFGRELKAWLRRGPRRGTKVGTLAKHLGVSQSTMYAYLAGTTLPPTDVLDDILHAIGVPEAEHRRLATSRDELERHRRRPTEAEAPPTRAVPRELPPGPTGFAGRTSELDLLDDALSASTSGGPPLAVLSGPAGVGKTALAVRWGHRMIEHFPDGALCVDLHGFAPGEPRSPGVALAGFLRSLGVSDADVPPDQQERANRLRSLLSGRRVLILLDNAFDVEQVRPLLPGEATCFVVVTSRNELNGLHVSPGAHQIPVRPMPIEVGEQLLDAHLPPRCNGRTPEAVRTLVARCDGLPLALRVVAAQASARPDASLDDLAAELAHGLDLLDVGDGATSVRAVFSWSEQRLSHHTAQALCLLAVAPVHELDECAAAELLGVDAHTARQRIAELINAHLVQRAPAGRVTMHDLVRAYARERADAAVSEAVRTAAIDRLLEYFTATAMRAMELLHPFETEEAPAEGAGSQFCDRHEAQVWIDTEWDNLTSAIRFAYETRRFEQTVALVAAVRRHLDQGGRYLAALTVLDTGRDAARRTGDRVAEATAMRDLGAACMRLGRNEEAMGHYRAVLALTREVGDRAGEAGTLNNLGNVLERLGEFTKALDCYHRALPIAREERLHSGEATLLVNLGVTYLHMTEYGLAQEHCEKALTIFEQVGDNGGAARSLGNIGDILRSVGAYADALDHLHVGLARAREIGAASIETEILNAIGATELARGSPDAARRNHETALASAREMGDRLEEGRALDGLSRALDALGESSDAEAARADASAIYTAFGLPYPERRP